MELQAARSFSLNPGQGSRWALLGDHACAAPLKCHIQNPVVLSALKQTCSEKNPVWIHHTNTSPRARVSLGSPALDLYWTLLFFFSRRERKCTCLRRKSYSSDNLQRTRAMLAAFQEVLGTPSLCNDAGGLVWLGALVLELGCSRCWCISTYSGTGKSIDKTAPFFKASCFLNIWIVSPGFLPPSNITHYCKEKFRSHTGKKKRLCNGQCLHGTGKDRSTVWISTAVRQAWEILAAGKPLGRMSL